MALMYIILLLIFMMHLFCYVAGIVMNTTGTLLKKMHISDQLKCNWRGWHVSNAESV